MGLHEIVLPETKPETEWLDGRAVQKVSPTYSHSQLQMALMLALESWDTDRQFGRFGPEWRFRLTPPGEVTRPLVPDVGYLSYEALSRDAADDDVEIPLASPTVAFEVLSPDDRPRLVAIKIATYLASGTSAVVVVDGRETSVTVHAPGSVSRFSAGDVVTLDAMPGLSIDVAALFARARR